MLIKCCINIAFWYRYNYLFIFSLLKKSLLLPKIILPWEEILGEEPGLSALITCIMARRQNWRLNNTSWVTPSHKWSCDLYSRNTNPEQLLCASTGEQWRGFPNDHDGRHKQGIVRLTAQWSKRGGGGQQDGSHSLRWRQSKVVMSGTKKIKRLKIIFLFVTYTII